LKHLASYQQQTTKQLQSYLKKIENSIEKERQYNLFLSEEYILLRDKVFGKSSEKEGSENKDKKKDKNSSKPKKRKVQLPSERYPNVPVEERDIELQELPQCSCCGHKMKDSGLTEDSEYLTVIPAKYIIIRQKRHKYSCSKCYGDIQTASCEPRIKPGSAFGDEMIIDVAMSKYCDLIPVERYAAIAGRQGLLDLPPQSLIELTHYLADFVRDAYDQLKDKIMDSEVLHADETPHRMLEGDEKSHWYLWGFSTMSTSYFDIQNTRSGMVASDFLKKSKCQFLMSDVFSGYPKAIRDINEYRTHHQLPLAENLHCNSHSRRYFKEARMFEEEAQYFIDQYKKIYRLNAFSKKRSFKQVSRARHFMRPLFLDMQKKATDILLNYSNKSKMAKALSYFLNNYECLTKFLNNPALPIDNNSQERLLRNPVIGRKTWYGTHSKRGAKTAAILFSLVESCKLNQVNPREYFKHLVQDLLSGKKAYTPEEFKNNHSHAVPDG